MTGISREELFRSTIRSSSTILALSSFLGSCARDGMVNMWFSSCSRADPYSSPTRVGQSQSGLVFGTPFGPSLGLGLGLGPISVHLGHGPVRS